jgi:hypothetical protein
MKKIIMLCSLFILPLYGSCKSTDVISLKYSARLVKFSGMDSAGGAILSTYEGPRLVTRARLTNIKNYPHSKSVSIEKDRAYFSVESGSVLVNKKRINIIELIFDEYALFESEPFRKGDLWTISLTPEGKLIEIKKTEKSEPHKPTKAR